MAVSDLLKPERYNTLKAQIKAEMLRRNQTGSVASYGGANYDYTTAPASDTPLKREHYEKLVQPLRAVNSAGMPSESGADKVVTEADMALMEAKTAQFKSIAMDSTSTGCGASCTGLCSSSCTGSCRSGCGNACSRGCSDGCSGSCGSSCQRACSIGCYGSCGGCGTTCVGDCEGECDTTCHALCEENCGVQCLVQCGACGSGCQLDYGCTGNCGGCGGCGKNSSGCASCAVGCATGCQTESGKGCNASVDNLDARIGLATNVNEESV